MAAESGRFSEKVHQSAAFLHHLQATGQNRFILLIRCWFSETFGGQRGELLRIRDRGLNWVSASRGTFCRPAGLPEPSGSHRLRYACLDSCPSLRPATGGGHGRGRPGDRNGGLPQRSGRRFRMPIATPFFDVLQRPVGSAEPGSRWSSDKCTAAASLTSCKPDCSARTDARGSSSRMRLSRFPAPCLHPCRDTQL